MDVNAFKLAPTKLIGMSKVDAFAMLSKNEFPFSVGKEDGKGFIRPMDVRIILNIESGVVIGSSLYAKSFGKW